MLYPCSTHAFAIACRISIEKDTKVLNAATFTLQREDHTVGNLVRMYALPLPSHATAVIDTAGCAV